MRREAIQVARYSIGVNNNFQRNKTGDVRITQYWGVFVQQLLQWKGSKYYMLSACICSPSYPACNAVAPICHLWPVKLYSIFLYARCRVDGVWLNARYNFSIYTENITQAVSRPNSNTGHIEEGREMLTFTPLRSVRWKDMAIKKDPEGGGWYHFGNTSQIAWRKWRKLREILKISIMGW